MRKLCQIFVCATPGEGRCGAKGGGEVLEMFKEEVKLRGIPPSAVLRNVCTRRHEEGPVVFVYPDDVWYTRVTSEDVPEIVERHLTPIREQKTARHSRASGNPLR
jgi:(2Fe-2S) ferredoxin